MQRLITFHKFLSSQYGLPVGIEADGNFDIKSVQEEAKSGEDEELELQTID